MQNRKMHSEFQCVIKKGIFPERKQMDGSFNSTGSSAEVKIRDKGEGLATASLILGILGALGFIFVLPPFLFGATAIVLSLLSSSGNGIALRAKIGMFMGAISMALIAFITASVITFFVSHPGIFKDYHNDFNELYEELYDEMYEELQDNGKGGWI